MFVGGKKLLILLQLLLTVSAYAETNPALQPQCRDLWSTPATGVQSRLSVVPVESQPQSPNIEQSKPRRQRRGHVDLSPLAETEAVVERKFVVRTSEYNALEPVLVRDDGQAPTNLKTGVSRLFSRELMVAEVSKTREIINTLTNRWRAIFKKHLEVQHRISMDARKGVSAEPAKKNGIFDSPFLNAYSHLAPREELVKQGSVGQQESWLKNYIATIALDNAKLNFLEEFTEINKKLVEELLGEYNEGRVLEPNFAKQRASLISDLLKYQEILNSNFHVPNDSALTELLSLDVDSAITALNTLAAKWKAALRNVIDLENLKKFDQVKKAYFQKVVEDIRAKLNTLVRSRGINSYLQARIEIRMMLQEAFANYKRDLQAQYPLPEASITAELRALLNADALNDEYVNKNADGKWEVPLPQAQARAIYEPEIASLIVSADPLKVKNPAFNLIMFHGAGTPKSNVASWNSIFAIAIQNGFNPFAVDLPGSVGERGIGLNSIRTAKEMVVYIVKTIELIAKQTKYPHLPFKIEGRSMGSLDIVMVPVLAAYYGIKIPENWIFTPGSFSNPDTMDIQTENVKLQLARGDIKGILWDAITHADELSKDFQIFVETAKKEKPRIFLRLGNNIWFMQGEADEDGGPDVIKDLIAYRDKYFPFAHIYIFEDPLKEYEAKGMLKGITPDQRESTHFLRSARANMTPLTRGNFPSSIPEKDWPKLRDQTLEGYAYMYLQDDYMIDLDPLASNNLKQTLRAQRRKFTGEDSHMGYLKWFVTHIVNPSLDPGTQLKTLDQIISDPSIKPSRDSGIYGRIKKLYMFGESEAQRIRLLNIVREG